MNDTFAGYRRPRLMTEALSAAVVAALREQPTQRLGQLLCNVTRIHTTQLFNLQDEAMLTSLLDSLSEEPDVWGCEYGHVAGGGCALAATVDDPPPTAVQLKDLLYELEEKKQELSRMYNRARRAESVVTLLEAHASNGAVLPEVLQSALAEYLEPTIDRTCRKCHQPIQGHRVYLEGPIDPNDVEGEFDVPMQGLYCP